MQKKIVQVEYNCYVDQVQFINTCSFPFSFGILKNHIIFSRHTLNESDFYIQNIFVDCIPPLEIYNFFPLVAQCTISQHYFVVSLLHFVFVAIRYSMYYFAILHRNSTELFSASKTAFFVKRESETTMNVFTTYHNALFEMSNS